MRSKFEKLKTGPRGPRKPKTLQLWDLTTEFFLCESCSTPELPVRFYQTGAQGKGMQCKNGDQCSCKSAVRRKDAVEAVCQQLTNLIAQDAELIESIILKSQEIGFSCRSQLGRKLAHARKQLSVLSNRVNDLFEMSGEGTEADRKEVKSRLRAAQSQRNATQSEVNRLQRSVDGTTNTLTAEQIRKRLTEMSNLLSEAASGELGKDAVYKALAVFRSLTGGQIMVPRRASAEIAKRTNVIGVFVPQLIRGLGSSLQAEDNGLATQPVTIWLRKPPRLDAIAQRVHELIDIERMSHRDAAKQLQREGHKVNSGNVWYSYHRWYEMQGLEAPKVPYNNGKKRRSA